MDVPDLITPYERAQFVAGALMGAQRTLLQLRVQQTLNSSADSDPIAGMEPATPGGDVASYGERRKTLEEGCRMLWEDNKDMQEQIKAFCAQSSEALTQTT